MHDVVCVGGCWVGGGDCGYMYVRGSCGVQPGELHSDLAYIASLGESFS